MKKVCGRVFILILISIIITGVALAKTNTTTTLASSANPSTYASSVTFTATVSPSAATGTVTFKDGSTTLGTGTLSSGKATYNTSKLAAGSHSITAVYGGNTNYNGSTSSVLTQTVNKANSTTTLSSSVNPSTYGSSVKFTATVAPSTCTGTVIFKDGSSTLGTGTVSSGKATFSTSTLIAGSHSITGSYAGDSNCNSSTSSTLTQTVNKANTSTALSSSSNPSAYGSSVTFTATISSTAAKGTVTFKDGSTTLGTGNVSSGIATYSTSSLAIGSHSITGVYSGDSNYNTSTSSKLTQTVKQASSVTVSSSTNPAPSASPVTFTAAVSPSAATGTVTFYDSSTSLGTGTLGGGVASLTTSSLALGSHSITAVYGGDANYVSSTSPVLTQSIKTLSSISLSPTNVSVPVGATQQFTATGTFSDATIGNITASVTWSSSATTVATVSTSGVATILDEGPTTVEASVGSINGSTTLTGTPSRFRFTGNLINARDTFTATVLQNGKVLIAGGISYPGGNLVPMCELYDPAAGTFSKAANLNVPRINHTATLLTNGMVLISGGQVSDGSGGLTWTASAELYDPNAGTFSLTGSLNQARKNDTATLLGSGLVLITGGNGPNGDPAAAELYNLSTTSFSTTGNLNTPRDMHTATLLNDGTVLIVGGESSSGSSLASAEIYDPSTGLFTATGSLNTASIGHTATLLNTGKVLIAGGSPTYAFVGALSRAELYDTSTKLFTNIGNLTATRSSFTATLLSTGDVLFVGGVDNSGNVLGTGELYDPTAGTFSLAGDLNNARGFHSAAPLNNGLVLIAGGLDAHVNDLNTAETYQSSAMEPPPLSLTITPAVVNMVLGGMQQFTAVDNFGYPRLDVSWTVSDPALASVTTDEDNAAILTALAPGQVTLTAGAEGVTAQEQVTILSSSSFPPGSVSWSNPPAAGFSAQQTIQAAPNSYVVSTQALPDLYSVQLNADGTQSMIQALTADGELQWQTQLAPVTGTSVPDGSGGLIVTTCASSQPMTVIDLDPTGQPVWQVQEVSVQGYGYICYPPQIAVGGDGTAYVVEPTNAGLPSLTEADSNGNISQIEFPPSTVTNNGNTINVQCCVGPPTVNTDDTAYMEYEVRNTNNNVITSDTLYLYNAKTGSGTVLSSTTQNEALLPGPIIPDGQGGIVATWTVSSPIVQQYPYQAVDVTNGVVGTPYNLPFSPQSVTPFQSPTLLLGENGATFATDGTHTDPQNSNDGPKIVSFNPVSGSVNWTYQVATQYTLAFITSASGGGLAAKSTDQNGNDTVIRFDSTGAATIDPWTGTHVDYYIGNEWTGITSGGSLVAYSAAPVQLSSSVWFEPSDGGSNKAVQTLNVTNFLTTGANQTTILNVYQKILAALPSYTTCNSWAQGSGEFQGTSGASFIQTMIQNTLFGHGSFDALHLNTSAITGTGGTTGIPAGIITAVNDNGAFFNATTTNSQGQTLTFDVGPRAYTGGTLKAQAFILLHELGHGITVAGFQHDNGIPKAGKANDKMVDQNCRSLIEGIQ